jgi:Ca2+:H+ antiporter
MQFVLGSEFFYLTCTTGCAVLAGGLIHKEQTAQTESSRMLASFLVFATTLLFVPAAMASVPAPAEHLESEFPVLALGISVVLLLLCGFYLLFQLKTHVELFDSVDPDAEEGDQEGMSNLTTGVALGIALIAIALYAACIYYLTTSIEPTLRQTRLTPSFVGFVLLPLFKSLPELLMSSIVATKMSDLDLVLGVTLGSSIHLILFDVPLIVVAGLLAKRPIYLDFDIRQATIVMLLTLVVAQIVSSGRTNFLTGLFLIGMCVLQNSCLVGLLIPNRYSTIAIARFVSIPGFPSSILTSITQLY